MTENLDDRAPVKNEENSAGQKILKFAVIFMGILIVLGLAVIVGTVVKRTVGKAGQDKAPADAVQRVTPKTIGDLNISLPKGATILSESLAGHRLMLRLQTEAGQKLFIYDLNGGGLLGTVHLNTN